MQRDRRPVTGLKAADFELLDNGVPQEITEVAYERLPIDVTFLLDVSASVTGPTSSTSCAGRCGRCAAISVPAIGCAC